MNRQISALVIIVVGDKRKHLQLYFPVPSVYTRAISSEQYTNIQVTTLLILIIRATYDHWQQIELI